jgi:adenylate cyclase
MMLVGQGELLHVMPMRLKIEVFENKQLCQTAEFDGNVELGRQRNAQETLYSRNQTGGCSRWVVARKDETTVGREQIRLTPRADGMVDVRNGSDHQPIRFFEHPELLPRETRALPMPFIVLLCNNRSIRIQRASPLQSLANVTLPPRTGTGSERVSRLPTLVGPGDQLSRADVLLWLSQAGELLQASAASPDYFSVAARVTADTVDLDAARVLTLTNGEWAVRAAQCGERMDPSSLGPPSSSILDRVVDEKRTFWEMPGLDAASSESLSGVETVVAAPILSKSGEVIGALYGERRRALRAGQPSLGALEARLVELLARIVAGGLARVEEERDRAKAQEMFAQVFGARLASQLRDNPAMLEGRDRDVSILFCDIRGFSRISEELGAAQTILWCRDVLGRLTACVTAEDGVVVDYVGDGMMAMWGAPGDQADHPARACRAALAILDELPGLNERWGSLLRGEMAIGMGVNTGIAQVGNVGSQHKLKYGALGSTVNIASRVEGASKYFKCPVLITGETWARLDGAFATRRLGQVRLVNIARPVQLFQLFPRGWPHAAHARTEYEKALDHFEAREFSQAARSLGNWRGQCPEDDPVLVLMYRAVRAMVEGDPPGHPVWELKEK